MTWASPLSRGEQPRVPAVSCRVHTAARSSPHSQGTPPNGPREASADKNTNSSSPGLTGEAEERACPASFLPASFQKSGKSARDTWISIRFSPKGENEMSYRDCAFHFIQPASNSPMIRPFRGILCLLIKRPLLAKWHLCLMWVALVFSINN